MRSLEKKRRKLVFIVIQYDYVIMTRIVIEMINVEMKNEVWKQYPEIPFIEVSSFGNVRTLDRVVPTKRTKRGSCFFKGRILSKIPIRNGYLQVSFSLDGKNVHKYVHRLVGETFIPNPDNLPQINHKDCDRTNNHVSNLEWCTGLYNLQYKEKYGISAEEALGRPVYAVNLTTLEVLRFRSRSEAGRQLGVDQSNITGVIKGKHKSAGGYYFVEDDGHTIKIDKNKMLEIANKKPSVCPVFAISLKTLDVLWFGSQSEAGREIGTDAGNISSVLNERRKTAGGYWFVNDDDNAIKAAKSKFGDVVAAKVEILIEKKKTT